MDESVDDPAFASRCRAAVATCEAVAKITRAQTVLTTFQRRLRKHRAERSESRASRPSREPSYPSPVSPSPLRSQAPLDHYLPPPSVWRSWQHHGAPAWPSPPQPEEVGTGWAGSSPGWARRSELPSPVQVAQLGAQLEQMQAATSPYVVQLANGLKMRDRMTAAEERYQAEVRMQEHWQQSDPFCAAPADLFFTAGFTWYYIA